ncbi:indole-3-glycerol phosphate synthase [Desulfuromusa kysingii]|uniref:Indole-3-glycerol phosphate synthase n=1 Tax=Desulfuromusa kysingii TaxID=37625 RepID=A0A1H3WZ81_9BACT|nr:indole-3-glycerol phosphate synthase TrpC [Desulfuromusa kysingii]SDZ92250.1 indole-3-glycerol phosphate synthase [Desulfuromusa kysingii]
MILDQILQTKRVEIAADRLRQPLRELKKKLATVDPVRGFARHLRQSSLSGTAVIAEVKKGSPSKGIIREDFDPVDIARSYERSGASCLSVLTDFEYFYGSLDYLGMIRRQVDLPLLRKDFIVDPYQIYQARVAGADAILLIAAALDDGRLLELAELATELELDTLLEVHNGAELERALQLPVDLIGINNRNLKNFVTDLGVTESLAGKIPRQQVAVAESGIHNRADIERLQRSGAGAFLIGESLMREKDIEAKLRSLLGKA